MPQDIFHSHLMLHGAVRAEHQDWHLFMLTIAMVVGSLLVMVDGLLVDATGVFEPIRPLRQCTSHCLGH